MRNFLYSHLYQALRARLPKLEAIRLNWLEALARLAFALVLALGFSLMQATPVHANTIVVSTNTNWSAITTGSGPGGLPSSADTLEVRGSSTLTVNVTDAVVGSLQLGGVGGPNSGTLTFSGANPSLTVTSADGQDGNVIVGGYGGTGRWGALTFTSGSSLSANTVTIGGSGSNARYGNINMTNGGTMTVAGLAVGTTADSQTWTPGTGTGTVVLNATNTLPGTIFTSFNNLTITAGTTTMGVSLTINGTLTVNGLLSPTASQTVSGTGTLTGNGTVNVTRTEVTADFSSQYTITNKTLTNLTVSYVGAAAQTLSALIYGNLKIDNSNGVTLAGSTNVSGTLTFSSGKITTGANNVTIGSSGSVTGAGTGKYVYGNLQKAFSTGAQSFTFDIGDASSYTPVALSFASITTGGNLTTNTTGSEHPNILTSGINSAKSVNRYWTLTNSGIVFTSSNYSATFNFLASDVDGGADTSIFIVGRYSDGWTYPTVGTRTSTSTQATGLTSLSDFAVGQLNWASYNDPGWTQPDDTFAAPETTVYMKGTGFADVSYLIAYYDNGGVKWSSETQSASGGTLTGAYTLTSAPTAAAGIWHTLVQPSTGYTGFGTHTYAEITAAPDTYGLVANDSFTVEQSAIPEFPTVMAGIAVASSCAAIYWWMRKRRLAYVQA